MISQSGQTADASPVLISVNLTKRFGGVVALSSFDLEVRPDEILGLIGPNGSGKTTFFNLATGIYPADEGHIRFDGTDITNTSPQSVYRAGISRTFQRSRLSLPLSIFDNVMIGNHQRLTQGLWFNLVRRGAFRREFEENYETAATCGADVRACRRPANDRQTAHRDLPGTHQPAEIAIARRAVGRHDSR
jgi:ABC-type branched-subunit amino acid transport system ATPase component